MKPLFWTAGLLCAWALLSGGATASTYSNGRTTLMLRENQERPTGFYFTTAEQRTWRGTIAINQIEAGAGHVYYTGRFRDATADVGRPMSCEGNITLDRTGAGGVAIAPRLKITWQVSGGQNCNAIGRTYELTLTEALPVANERGDFVASRANTWITENAVRVTWRRWRVVTQDGALNCRRTGNGDILSVYRRNQPIEVSSQPGNAIQVFNGEPWLLTSQQCYVRANSRYIAPVSLPD